jgi:ABC-type glutathione transport system ATPase component
MSIRIKNVSKRFGSFRAVDDVSLEVPSGSLVALLGPSGSGKTTLLRIIAGLEVADRGAVLHDDEDITDYEARDRKLGFVFQHYALFRHMTIADNIGYGLRVRGVPKAERMARVDELLKLVRLEGSFDSKASGHDTRPSSPAASGSASRSPERWRRDRACYCSTNPSARSTRRSARSSGNGCASSTRRSRSRAYSSRTTRRRPSRSPITSSS